jgi:glycosyltransferase involved in cell wall biosynthesis
MPISSTRSMPCSEASHFASARVAGGKRTARRRTSRRPAIAYVGWRVCAPLLAALYRTAVRHLAWWPLAIVAPEQPLPVGERRVAYYLSLFPLLSETFIQREVAALRAAGISVEVLAHRARDEAHFGEQAQQMQRTTTYIASLEGRGVPPGLWQAARRHPLRLANVFLYAVVRRHTPTKSFRGDRRLFNRAVYLARMLREKRINHVHAPWANPDATVAMMAARLAGIRYTVQARASEIHRHRSVFGRRERLMGAALVVTNTRYNEAFLRAVLPADGAPPVRVIYNGIDLSRFHPAPRRHDAPAVRRILCVGRLVEPKGLEYLLGACTLLRDRGASFQCEIVGGRMAHDINYYLRIKRLWRTLGLESVVQFVGALPFEQVLSRHAAADVFVFPAVMAPDGRREVTPNVLIEAMAMQCAVIGTTIGAIPEIIEDGVSGLLVPPRDENALADAISRLLDNPGLRETLGSNARRRVEDRFDIRRNIQAYVELFGGKAPELKY